jgi:hypothetical protein
MSAPALLARAQTPPAQTVGVPVSNFPHGSLLVAMLAFWHMLVRPLQ